MDFKSLIQYVLTVLYQAMNASSIPLFYRYLFTEGFTDLPPQIILNTTVLNFFFNFLRERHLNQWRLRRDIYIWWGELTWKDISCSFICGFCAAVQPFLNLLNFKFASTKGASIVSVSALGMVFILNLLFRKEKLSMTKACWVKVFGVFVASVVGPVLQGFCSDGSLFVQSTSNNVWKLILGIALGILSSQALGTWFTNNVQERMSPRFKYTSTMATLTSFFATIIVGIIYTALSVFYPHDKKDRDIEPNTTMTVLAYLSVVGGAALQSGLTWCVQVREPAYVAEFGYLPPFINTLAGPYALESNQNPGWLTALVIGFGARVLHWGRMMEASAEASGEASAQVTNISSGDHQGKHLIDHLESQPVGSNVAVELASVSITVDE